MEIKRLTEQTFNYVKKNGEKGEQNVFVLDVTDKGFGGISLKYLSEEDRTELLDVANKLNDLVSKNMSAYRNYLTNGVVEN